MFCGNCGTSVGENVAFCPNCGMALGQSEAPQAVPDNAPTPAPVKNAITESFQKNTSYISSSGARGFVDPDEIPLYSLSNGVAAHLITGRGLVKDDAILTNKRLYYSYHSGLVNRRNNEEIVNLEDITGTKIFNHNPVLLLIISILCALATLILLIKEEQEAGLIALLVAAIFFFAYFLGRSAGLSVEYAGGYIDLVLGNFGLSDMRLFQRCIYVAKNIQKTEDQKEVKEVFVVNNEEKPLR